jgi:hypothetical protein
MKYLILAILFTFIFVVHCAAEHKAIQPTHVPQEKCDTPVWNVGDYWKYQYEDKQQWSHKLVRVENGLYIIDNPEVRCT